MVDVFRLIDASIWDRFYSRLIVNILSIVVTASIYIYVIFSDNNKTRIQKATAPVLLAICFIFIPLLYFTTRRHRQLVVCINYILDDGNNLYEVCLKGKEYSKLKKIEMISMTVQWINVLLAISQLPHSIPIIIEDHQMLLILAIILRTCFIDDIFVREINEIQESCECNKCSSEKWPVYYDSKETSVCEDYFDKELEDIDLKIDNPEMAVNFQFKKKLFLEE